MKNSLLLIVFLLLQGSVFASYSELFAYNQKEIDQVLQPLEQLEQRINELEKGDPQAYEQCLSLGNHQNTSFGGMAKIHPRDPMGISPFCWGCFLGPIGVGVVLAAHGEMDAVMQTTLGCAVPSAIFALGIYFDDPFLMHFAIDIFFEVWDAY